MCALEGFYSTRVELNKYGLILYHLQLVKLKVNISI